jgi:hypothetical protein
MHLFIKPLQSLSRLSDYCVGLGVLNMRQIGVSKYEQQLSEHATEVRKQMTELRQLRELVRLAGAAKALHRPNRLARSAVNSKVVDPFAGPQLRV